MAVSKAKKQAQVEKLTSDLKQVGNLVVATFGKLTVAQDYELRKAVRGAGAKALALCPEPKPTPDDRPRMP